jgi:hypothetical protein
MRELWSHIREAITNENYLVAVHAAARLRQRRIPIWQAVAASVDGKLLVERLDATPNATAELEILLADGVAAKAVWAWLADDATAKLVTVHFFDR